MDFWDHLFDNEYKRRADIEALKRTARQRNQGRMRDFRKLDDQEKRVSQLEEQVGELGLLCRTLLTILRETEIVTPERLQQVMQQIDAEDGVEDGRITPPDSNEDPPEIPEIRTW